MLLKVDYRQQGYNQGDPLEVIYTVNNPGIIVIYFILIQMRNDLALTRMRKTEVGIVKSGSILRFVHTYTHTHTDVRVCVCV